MNKEQYQIIKEAMDVHAESISLLFHEWAYNNKYRRMNSGLWSTITNSKIYTHKELYNKFTKEIITNENKPFYRNA